MVAATRERIGLILVSMADQPLTRLRVQLTQRRASSNHHPHGKLGIGWLPFIPLFLGYKKCADLLYI